MLYAFLSTLNMVRDWVNGQKILCSQKFSYNHYFHDWFSWLTDNIDYPLILFLPVNPYYMYETFYFNFMPLLTNFTLRVCWEVLS